MYCFPFLCNPGYINNFPYKGAWLKSMTMLNFINVYIDVSHLKVSNMLAYSCQFKGGNIKLARTIFKLKENSPLSLEFAISTVV